MNPRLSPYQLGKAREAYNLFNIFNVIAWNLLVGVIITLFALRLGASSTYIGLLSALLYLALFLLPLGKIIARRFSIIRLFSFTSIMRSICMILAVIAPFVDYAGHRNAALLLIMLGVFLFHCFRGIGMIGNNPVLSQLAVGPDKGSYMTQIQITSGAIGMLSSFLIALILGMEPPIFVFSILLSAGVITGIISGYKIRKVPEPRANMGRQSMGLIAIFKEALSQSSLRHFIVILFLVVMASGVMRIFVVVYAREVFGHNDGLVSLYAVFGGLGFLIAGLSVKFLVDRIGTKPLFLVCVSIGLVSIISVIAFPLTAAMNMTSAILFMSFLFFALNFGFLGSEGIAQTYFLALIPEEKMLDFGILYFFIFGAAGAIGSFLAGFLLDFLQFIGFSPMLSFKMLFGILAVLTAIAIILQKNMKGLGSLPIKDALEVIFSPKDLRAISLLDRLNKAEDSQEENLLIGELHNTPSHLALEHLLEKARSPKLDTRQESIRALGKLQKLNAKAEQALIADMTQSQFTTAYISARILGKHGCKAAIPTLREVTASTDYMLAGEAMIALAKMKDEEFRTKIEHIILNSHNPRIKIMGAEALGYYLNVDSIPVLLDILRSHDLPLYLRDEIILAIASILNIPRFFYKILVRYKSDNSLAIALAMDEVESACEFVKTTINAKKKVSKDKVSLINSHVKNFDNAVSRYIRDNNGDELSRWIIGIPNEYSKSGNAVKEILSETVMDDRLILHNRLRLLIINWCAHELRVWASRLK